MGSRSQDASTSRARPSLVPAAICWIAAATVYLVAEAVTAAGFAGYSYAANFISDLGVPDVGVMQGRPIDSPRSAVMNAGFIAHGILAAAGAAAAVRARPGVLGRGFLVLAVLHLLGITAVALVPGGPHTMEHGLGAVHTAGAGAAICGGNLATVLAAFRLRRSPAPRAPALVGAGLGVLGLLSAAVLVLHMTTDLIPAAPGGAWERAAVYPIQAAELLAATVILSRSRRAGHLG
ncbi:hypothetical protein BF93_08155 [Brachybacterium phenoliresistens]|uniref:DUF998 domain-containing protein n=1 Tax=Brachybacterium phenoliresistens TaxID=396014 RepID=Z9JNR1_9MICO|nr:DUF998 domain-containing protein [Brachybacterium phenoliresistens]EWS80015.1 hypothetical protein BF93_08155 [Brachybacterium phenoliresistens]